MMSFPSKQEWYSSLSKAEKRIYGEPDAFFSLCAVYIDRYHDNLWMARNAHKAIYEAAPVPTDKTYEAGCMRIEMYRSLRDYAELRDHGADREAAISIMNLEREGINGK